MDGDDNEDDDAEPMTSVTQLDRLALAHIPVNKPVDVQESENRCS